ncbi:type IV pilus twitching motility protein PilT [Cellulomonas composti]|uniref:type IV pilus twitching motility protein PilT n=1 Tax=Cellulomonas composti TaxID=266130 RepID=UPI001FE30654|nr:type IV pilus twitching motility protein PilT [Cellulomonas composti]
MTEPSRPVSGEPTRPLPPYRPAGPQPAAAPGAPGGPVMFSPIPSQSTAPAAPAAPAPYPPQPSQAPGAPMATSQAGQPLAPQARAPQPIVQPTAQPTMQPTATSGYVPAGAAPGSASVAAVREAYRSPIEQTAVLPSAPKFGGQVTFTPAVVPPPAEVQDKPVEPTFQRPAVAQRDRTSRLGVSSEQRDDDLPIDEVLAEMVRLGASDVHLTTGAPPMVRVSGNLQQLDGFGTMSPEPLRRVLYGILTQKQRETFESNLELDLSYAVRGLARFRVNIYQQRESIGAAFRVIPYEIKPLEQLGVPAVVGTFAGLPRGLVLVTGPTGSGKSTTLASIVDLANRTREDHIMTVEDPIEFLHRHKKCLVNQREVGADTLSFANALKHVLRQDPDIILVGEMRDLETISVALTAAETGHLVFATLHTSDAAQTIDRVIDVFPAHQQDQVRTQLAGALQGVVCQTLCKRADTPGRAVATEVLVATPAIRNLIREGKTHQIYSSMQAGAKQGMHTMDQHLAELVKTGKITYEVGLEKCHHVEDFNRLTGRFSGQTQGSAGLGGGDLVGGGETNAFGKSL